MSSNEIIQFYLSKISQISSQFPIESSKLQETHKNALNSILTKFNIPSISFDIKKQINSEFSKFYTKNLERKTNKIFNRKIFTNKNQNQQ